MCCLFLHPHHIINTIGGETLGPGMDCLQIRHHPHHHQQPPGPFHYLINEQAKSLVALQELQHEVGALLEFRDLVIETFPNLRTKLSTTSTPVTMMTSSPSSSHNLLHHNNHHIGNSSSSSSGQHNVNLMNVSSSSPTSNIPVSIRAGGDWTPGVRVRKKLGSGSGGNKDDARSSCKKIGDSSNSATGVQDSGFSTETSSKETHSASSTAPPPSTTAQGTASEEADETEDELWNLLDIIHRKGTRLKDEVEALQGALREQNHMHQEESDFQRVLFHGSADDIRMLRQERDLLLDRVAEMEAEVLAGRIHTTRLQEDLENLLSAKHDLEEQLKAVVSQRGEVNSRIHDLHLQFVTKSDPPNQSSSPTPPPSQNKSDSESDIQKSNSNKVLVSTTMSAPHQSDIPNSSDKCSPSYDNSKMKEDPSSTSSSQQQREKQTDRTATSDVSNSRTHSDSASSIATKNDSDLDVVLLGDLKSIPKVKVPDKKKFAAILKEQDYLVLQKHLLCSTVQNQVLHEKLDTAARLEIDLTGKLDKAREENDELRFQLEDKNIELEGTRARVRMFEQLQKSLIGISTSPDIIPGADLPRSGEITHNSMKHMSPIPIMMNHHHHHSPANLQIIDHSSSTESAHDQAENNFPSQRHHHKRSSSSESKRKPSKIPLKSYTAPKPPGPGSIGGSNNNKHSPRSRSSGESPAAAAAASSAGRPHSAQSWSRSQTTGQNSSQNQNHISCNNHQHSLSGSTSNSNNNSKSRNGSLVQVRDSYSSKLRGSDSLSKLSPHPVSNNSSTTSHHSGGHYNQTSTNSSSFGSHSNSSRGNTLRNFNNKTSSKWSTLGGAPHAAKDANAAVNISSSSGEKENIGDSTEPISEQISLTHSTKEKSRYPWTLSSFNSSAQNYSSSSIGGHLSSSCNFYNSDIPCSYPDSLDSRQNDGDVIINGTSLRSIDINDRSLQKSDMTCQRQDEEVTMETTTTTTTTTATSSSSQRNYHTANNSTGSADITSFLWNNRQSFVGATNCPPDGSTLGGVSTLEGSTLGSATDNNSRSEFYDSIDSNVLVSTASSLYDNFRQQNGGGEDLAECDSLETKQFSDFSDTIRK